MSSNNDVEEIVSTLVILFCACAFLVLFMVATPFALALGAGYIGYLIWRDNPARHERIASQHMLEMYEKVMAQNNNVMGKDEVDRRLSAHFPGGTDAQVRTQLLAVGRKVFEKEKVSIEVPPPPAVANSVEGARYRDMLARISQSGIDPNMGHTTCELIAQSIGAIARRCPQESSNQMVPVEYFIPDLGPCVGEAISPFFGDDDYGLFKELRSILDFNLSQTAKDPIYPHDYDRDDAVDAYLKGTPLIDLFSIDVPFIITDAKRAEHHFVLGGSGHGKTQCLQTYIARDIEKVKNGRASVVVIDSQGDLIDNIRQLEGLDETNTVIIDPNDIAFPCSLNLFDVQMERINAYDPLARERQLNGILELYDFVLGALLSAEMTQKQNVIFRYVTRLMLVVPDATILTMLELFQDDGYLKYRPYIDKLDQTAQNFFKDEFNTREFSQTKRQVVRRLYGILENQSFRRMFSNPRSKLDLFMEMNAGKLILINTAKGLLKEQGTEIFGRFFIAMITQAAQEREEIPKDQRMPTYVYIDEASDYRFDEKIDLILTQARKYKVGLTMATQYLDKISPKLQAAIASNTSIKFAGGVSNKDARRMAADMKCAPEFIENMPLLTFAAHVRGYTHRAVPLTFTYGYLESLPKASEEAQAALLDAMREKFAAPINAEEIKGDGYTMRDSSEDAQEGDDQERHEPEEEAAEGGNTIGFDMGRKRPDEPDIDPL